MLTTHKAIQTRYKNCKFRSRLEARWAVFFDHCGVEWQYEPEGFDLSAELDNFAYSQGDWDGAYLPDFYLPEFGTWVEIKGSLPDDHFGMTLEEVKVWCLAKHTGKHAVIFFGPPEDDTKSSRAVTNEWRPRMEREPYDSLVFFAVNIDRSKALPGPKRCPIANASIAAMSARFEFGESGAPAL